jgi:hypothetical protein
MKNWDPAVRAAVIDIELVANLGFSCDKKSDADAATLRHLEGTAFEASATEIVTLVRPDTAVFQAQTKVLLERDTQLRRDRSCEILAQLGYPMAFWASVGGLYPERHQKTFELLAAAMRLANFVEMRFKQALACPRPMAYSHQIQPIIQTPGHGSLPSGHATEAFMTARVLEEVLSPAYDAANARLLHEQLMGQAARIAINRQIAGVHFPVDSAAGQILGLALGEYFLTRCKGGGALKYLIFNGTRFSGDFGWRDIEPASGGGPNAAWLELSEGPAIEKSKLVEWLWKEASQEWRSSTTAG